ncbi:transcriptional regulator, TetR family [Afipia carboxidovorans OM5]|uniref:Transcriptional regulatory protein n=1 Tax=Afipia carboxidovorans (strain ATCC 49405 / DSM 1227 / KCTC 32145 / OM5) TaxID=504832 RepID=B6JCE5_AFIC5|nr:TetR/AcrR family transcriptional regulator [Afipia carboxidovorans]ACI92361.1 transcriptional regulator, TetR family [Afipia carboxidovorans OM5]AEI03857.1 transcriptional regulatory protein [Afipia carboxidovorans OM4]AEI07434.1 transcriptional regulatory protein [Afipia carboxidovorans OM5]BEV44967.1 TetR/AcrR family transcriptional regulator [Afipia carboxidovorans]
MIPSPPPLPANDEDSAKRRQIVEGARKVFRELGFDAASMGEIAKAAGVSKGTLYVYFADKLALFGAIVTCELREQGIDKLTIDPTEAPEATLQKFGQSYMEMLCRPTGGSTIRTMMSIAERMPELGRRYYESVPAAWLGRLADYLRIQVANGALAIDDCDLAAAQFMLSCQATLFLPFIFQVTPAPSSERIADVVASATRMFLAAYRR